MTGHLKAKVLVNKLPVELNEFVESYFASIAVGIVKSLKGVDYVQDVKIHQEKGDVTIIVNGEEIPIKPFPNDIIKNTVFGMLSPLKGFDKVEQFDIIVDS